MKTNKSVNHRKVHLFFAILFLVGFALIHFYPLLSSRNNEGIKVEFACTSPNQHFDVNINTEDDGITSIGIFKAHDFNQTIVANEKVCLFIHVFDDSGKYSWRCNNSTNCVGISLDDKGEMVYSVKEGVKEGESSDEYFVVEYSDSFLTDNFDVLTLEIPFDRFLIREDDYFRVGIPSIIHSNDVIENSSFYSVRCINGNMLHAVDLKISGSLKDLGVIKGKQEYRVKEIPLNCNATSGYYVYSANDDSAPLFTYYSDKLDLDIKVRSIIAGLLLGAAADLFIGGWLSNEKE